MDDPKFHFDHVALSVPDIEAAERFYAGALGLAVTERKSWGPGDARMDAIFGLAGSSGHKLLLHGGQFALELWQFTAPVGPEQVAGPVSRHGIAHIGLKVSDIAALCAKLHAAGMTFHGPPSRGPTGSLAVYGRDPFGNIVELVQPPPEA